MTPLEDFCSSLMQVRAKSISLPEVVKKQAISHLDSKRFSLNHFWLKCISAMKHFNDLLLVCMASVTTLAACLSFKVPIPTKIDYSNKVIDKPKEMKRIVLVGGGHAHVQVIKALNKASRPDNIHVTLIDMQDSASYSGMVPGCVAGLYKPEQTQIQLRPLAKWAGIEFVSGQKVIDIDPTNRKVYIEPCRNKQETQDIESVQTIDFDVVSLDIGSTSRGIPADEGESWKQHVISTRPVWELVQKIEEAEKSFDPCNSASNQINVKVVGAGAAGIELALAIRARWDKYCPNFRITILDGGNKLFPNENESCRQALEQILSDKKINVSHNTSVQNVRQNELDVITNDHNNGKLSTTFSFSHCLWAAGAAPHTLASKALKIRGISVSDHGWIRVSPTMQTLSHDSIFAAGDCVTIEGLKDHRASPPKAGVYAVRAGPILIQNLISYLEDKELTNYEPQDDFLKLIMCGDGTALGFRFGLALRGPWVWKMKDDIDQHFMDLFKEENLPSLEPGVPYDTKQYDDENENERNLVDPQEASSIIQRTGDGVDFRLASQILRNMRDNDAYKKEVLSRVRKPQSITQ